jgi:hypothetical protein
MKIKLTKKRNSTTVRFSADDHEGVDLKDVILSTADENPNELITGAIEKLGRLGYEGGLTKETRNTREFTLKRTVPAPPCSNPSSD